MQTKGLSAAEIKDRTAIQHTWVSFWTITDSIVQMPKESRRAALEKVVIESLIPGLLSEADDWNKKGWISYGTTGHRPYWGPPADGKDTAIMGDCMDLSHTGHMVAKTGVKLTVGTPRVNVRALVQRSGDGSWRITGYEDLRGEAC